jgi:hypothetical protein
MSRMAYTLDDSIAALTRERIEARKQRRTDRMGELLVCLYIIKKKKVTILLSLSFFKLFS